MTFTCVDLEDALASEDERSIAAAREHAQACAACRRELELDDALSAAARTLHREWESPRLWPEAAARMQAPQSHTLASRLRARFQSGRSWRPAMAAALILVIGSAAWVAWPSLAPVSSDVDEGPARLLTEDALAEIERSEAEYVRAIEELARLAAPKLAMPEAPLLASLRERLIAIDAAITEYHAEIDRNPFNADLRRQLLWIYQEKHKTLEQVEEYADAL